MGVATQSPERDMGWSRDAGLTALWWEPSASLLRGRSCSCWAAEGSEHAQCWAWCRALSGPQLCVRPSPRGVSLQVHPPPKVLKQKGQPVPFGSVCSLRLHLVRAGVQKLLCTVPPPARRAAPSFPPDVPQHRLSRPLNQRGKQNNEQLMQGGLWSTQSRGLQRSQAQP